MPSNETETRLNQSWWNERAALHRQTPLYQTHIARLEAGGLSLLPTEVAELGEITGLSVLHLQCHIGTDSLSLARLGATVTGVDFSDVAIREARQLSVDLKIPASFETCEISEVGQRYPERFDLVFTSHGVLPWLPNLNEWAQQISECLKPGGSLYLSDSHPLMHAIPEQGAVQDTHLKLELPYLAQARPLAFEGSGSYADPELPTHANETREWLWGLGDVVNALIGAGLTLRHLHEHPVGFFPLTPEFHEGTDGHFRLPEPLDGRFPLTFTIRATKG